jgi:Xaa-Pro aminopeptidase
MVLAIETFVGEGKQGVRLEENLLVTETGYEILSLYPYDSKLAGS